MSQSISKSILITPLSKCAQSNRRIFLSDKELNVASLDDVERTGVKAFVAEGSSVFQCIEVVKQLATEYYADSDLHPEGIERFRQEIRATTRRVAEEFFKIHPTFTSGPSIVLTPLRAGVPMMLGIQDLLGGNMLAGCIDISRDEHTLDTCDGGYVHFPQCQSDSACLIVVDTMLATGGGSEKLISYALKHYKAQNLTIKAVLFISVFSVLRGINRVCQTLSETGIKENFILTAGYLSPGLGLIKDFSNPIQHNWGYILIEDEGGRFKVNDLPCTCLDAGDIAFGAKRSCYSSKDFAEQQLFTHSRRK